MSIDNRVVHLGFDNAQFESGVKQSMSTLDKLKEKLKFNKESNGLTGLQSALNNVDFSALAQGIESIEHRFSAMGIAGMTVVSKITDSIIGAAKNLEQATIGQIKSGGWSRAMNLANAQFTIEGLKLDWDEMLKSINYGVQDTAYGLDAAAKAAASLAASGVDYKESVDGANDSLMHTSLRAISGVAAMTNSSYEEISHVFTTVAGQGRLMSEQLNSLAARGMNAAATLGEQLGHSEAEIREMVSKGKIDFETFAKAMDSAFGEHAKEANKTFQGALSNMKAALSRIGAIFATPIINKTNVLFIALTDRIKEFQKALSDTTDETGNKVIRFAGHFTEAWETGIEVISELIHKLDLSWFDAIAEKMDSIAVKTRDFFNDFKFLISGYHDDVKDGAKETTKILSVTAKEAEAAKKVIAGAYGYGQSRHNALAKEFGEDSAKRIQDYVDSVKAAGWSYEKATIKIEEGSEDAANSMSELVKQQKEQRKIKFHAVMNQISAGLSNLWRAAKNLVTNASKIGGAIMTAFKNVFGIKDGAYDATKGITGFLVKFADFTEKLIISEDTATKITEKFTSFFTTIKKGISYIVSFTKWIGELITKFIGARIAIANLPQAAQDAMAKAGVGTRIFGFFQTLPSFVITIKDKIVSILESLRELKLPFVGSVGDILKSIKSGDAWEQIKNFGTSMWDTINTAFNSVDWSNKISGLFNFLLNIITGINWGDAGKIGAVAFVASTLTKVLLAFRTFGNMAAAMSMLPQKISIFLTNFSKMVYNVGIAAKRSATASMIWTIAKSIALVAGVLIAMANVDQKALYSAAAVLVVIAFVLARLAKLVDLMTNQSDSQSGLKTTIMTLTSSIRLIYSMAVLIAAIGAAVVLMGAGLAILKQSGVDSETLLYLLGILSMLGLMAFGIVEIIKAFPKDMGAAKEIGGILSMSVLITAIGGALLQISFAAKAIGSIPLDALPGVIGILTLCFVFIGSIIGISSLIVKYNFASILSVAALVAAIGFAISAMIMSIATAMTIITTAAAIGNSDASSLLTPILAFVGMLSMIFLVITGLSLIAAKIAKEGNGGATVAVLLSMTAMISALSGAVLLLGVSMKIASSLDANQFMGFASALLVFVLGIVALVREVSNVEPKQLLAAAVAFIAIGVAMNLLVLAVSHLSKISFAASGLLIAAGVIALVIIAFSKIAQLKDAAGNISSAASEMRGINASIGYVIAGVIAFAAGMLILAAALKVMDQLENTVDSMLIMVGLILAVGAAIALLTLVASKSFNSGDALFAIGAAFIMIAASMLIFAAAVEKMASVSGNMLTVAITFGVFLLALVGLGALVAKFPALGEGITTVGKAFLYMGLGAALVGAGLWLVSNAIMTILPVIPILIIDAQTFLTMLEDHYPVLIIITIIIAAITVAIVALGATVGPIVKAVAETIAEGAKAVLRVLESIATAAKNFVSNMSTKGKATLVALITTLCGVLVKTSPEVVKTIGTIIIKVLGYLGSIIGTLVSALLEFIINLINGLANAIRSHSNRIAAAIFNLLYSLIDVVLAVLKELMYILFGNVFGGKIADFLGRFLDHGQETLDAHAAKMLADAEAADAAKESLMDYNKELEKQAKTIADEETGHGGGGAHWVSDEDTNNAKSIADYVKDAKNSASGGIDLGINTDSIKGFDITKSLNLDAAASNEFQNYMSSDYMSNLGPDYFKTGEENAGSYDDGFSSYFQSDGVDSAYDNGQMYNSSFASSIDSTDSRQEVSTATDNLMEVVDERIDDHKNEITQQIIPDVMHNIYAAMVNNSGEVFNGARFIVDGIKQAIDERLSEAEKAGENLATAVYDDGFIGPRGIDANSPSKKFYQGGLYCVQGVANAVNQNQGLATHAMTSLSDQMIDSFGNPLAYAAKMASGEIQYDPTIRPVMDMSSARMGAMNIGSMFRDQSVSLTGLSGQIAYDMTNLNGSNAAVVAEIQALREDMDVMTDELANMQIVMDTGALVGSTVGAYDAALGKRQFYSGRGN